MTIATVRAVLVADSAVIALVPAIRIEPMRRTQSFALPAITLQVISKVPFNHLRGDGRLDLCLVQVDYWATSYTQARQAADAGRAALNAAGMTMTSEIDGGFEPETDPELFRITQSWSVYSTPTP
jgi:hypothetical protein